MQPRYSLTRDGRPVSIRQRVLLGLGLAAGIVVAAAAVAAISLDPGDDLNPAISVIAQLAIPTPVVDGVNGRVSAHMWYQFEMAYMYPSLSLEEILRRFSDARINPAERRLFAYRLA